MRRKLEKYFGIKCVCFKLLYLWQSAAEVFISDYEILFFRVLNHWWEYNLNCSTALYPIVNTQAIYFHFTALYPISIHSRLAIFSHILDLQNGCILKIFPHNIVVTWLEMLLYAYNVLPVHSISTTGSCQIAFTILFLPSGCLDNVYWNRPCHFGVHFNLQSCCPSILIAD